MRNQNNSVDLESINQKDFPPRRKNSYSIKSGLSTVKGVKIEYPRPPGFIIWPRAKDESLAIGDGGLCRLDY